LYVLIIKCYHFCAHISVTTRPKVEYIQPFSVIWLLSWYRVINYHFDKEDLDRSWFYATRAVVTSVNGPTMTTEPNGRRKIQWSYRVHRTPVNDLHDSCPWSSLDNDRVICIYACSSDTTQPRESKNFNNRWPKI